MALARKKINIKDSKRHLKLAPKRTEKDSRRERRKGTLTAVKKLSNGILFYASIAAISPSAVSVISSNYVSFNETRKIIRSVDRYEHTDIDRAMRDVPHYFEVLDLEPGKQLAYLVEGEETDIERNINKATYSLFKWYVETLIYLASN